jgi:hypothetical protein
VSLVAESQRATRARAFLLGERGHEVLVVTFLVNTQQMLMPGFDDTVHDVSLGIAHDNDYMPEGQPIVTKQSAQPTQPVEGVRMFNDINDVVLDNAILQGDIIEVRSEWAAYVSMR